MGDPRKGEEVMIRILLLATVLITVVMAMQECGQPSGNNANSSLANANGNNNAMVENANASNGSTTNPPSSNSAGGTTGGESNPAGAPPSGGNPPSANR